MTPEEIEARKNMHPSVAANFVYLPDPSKLSDEDLHRLFPKEQVQRFFRDALAAPRQLPAHTESESA